MQWRSGYPHLTGSERSSDSLKVTQQRPEQDLGTLCQHHQTRWSKEMVLGAEVDRPWHWPFLRWSWSAWSSRARSPRRCSPPWQQADSSGDNGMSWLLCAPAPTRKAHTSLGWSTGICYHTCSPHMPATDGLTMKLPRVKHLFKALCPVRQVQGAQASSYQGFINFSIICFVISPHYLSRDPR